MRFVTKGGIWKNTEDEILKAAVMKYGLNQWDRISSLIVRKSGKQCKARWYEWLDPGVKKTEWSREEEEKLLHLAKLMPTQWTTIGPLVGRTAQQCLEHYEKLLDAASGTAVEEGKEGESNVMDPRRLRAGEVDPHPETRPARPDPIDMEEEEKEMLSEARARLANTSGKKRKRRAREAALDEARKLAHIAKAREMKAAGLEYRSFHKRVNESKMIDLSKEIPFYTRTPQGAHDTSDERMRESGKKAFTVVELEKLDGKRRIDRQKDEEKEDKKRLKRKMRENLPEAIKLINKLNEPSQVRKRSKLMLPMPQMTERELEEIAKITQKEMGLLEEDEQQAAATSTLLANYHGGLTPAGGSASASMSMRTPLHGAAPQLRTPLHGVAAATGERIMSRNDSIMMEARNQALERGLATPLMGENQPEIVDTGFGKTGRIGVRPEMATPNLLLTPKTAYGAALARGRTPGLNLGMTPGLPASTQMPNTTPMRDALSINEDETLESTAMRRRAIRKAQQGLSALPKPRDDYQIVVPEVPDLDHVQSEPDFGTSDVVEDQQDRVRRLKNATQRSSEAKFSLASQAVQRQLPRPSILPQTVSAVQYNPTDVSNEDEARARAMVQEELFQMLCLEAQLYPFGKKGGVLNDEQTRAAQLMAKRLELRGDPADAKWSAQRAEGRRLVEKEGEVVRAEAEKNSANSTNAQHVGDVNEQLDARMLFVPSELRWIDAKQASKEQRVAAYEAELEALQMRYDATHKKSEKAQKKARVRFAGLEKRAKAIYAEITELHRNWRGTCDTVEVYETLRKREEIGAQTRLKQLKERLAQMQKRERELQLVYAEVAAKQ